MKKHYVTIYRPSTDCTNDGLTGNRIGLTSVWLVDPEAEGDDDVSTLLRERVLIVDHRQGRNHPCLTPRAVPGTVDANGKAVADKGWATDGGNFVATSDSRFREAFGGPLSVHDRFE